MDHEQNFLMQVQGTKKAWVWTPESCLTSLALEEFHALGLRNLAVFEEPMKQRAECRILTPGTGVFMPMTSPHLVENGNGVSITVSFTYCSNWTKRIETISRFNTLVRRRLKVEPSTPGQNPFRDQLKYTSFAAFSMARDLLKGADPKVPHWARGSY